MVKVRLLDAFGEYAAGDEVELESAVAEKLVAAGLAEAVEEAPKGEECPKGDEDVDKAVSAITSRLEKTIAERFSKAEPKAVKLPAKPIDRTAGLKNLGDWLRCKAFAALGDHNAQRKPNEFTAMRKAASGQTEADAENYGSHTVPEIWADKLWEKIRSEFLLLDHTMKYEASGDTVRVPIINDTSRVDGSRPLRYYSIGEGSSYTYSKIVTGQVVLNAYKYGVLAAATLELLRDSNSNFEQVITDQIAKEIRFALNDLLINGSGSSAPAGVLNQNCKVTVSKESGQGSMTVWLPNLAKMVSRLPYGAASRAMFLYNRAVMAPLIQLAFDPSATSKTSAWGLTYNSADEWPLRFQGIPMQELEQCAALGNAGDIILVDPSAIAAFVKPVEVSVSEHALFTTDEIVYKGTVRFDCDNHWSAAETPYKGSSTVSPVVVLESRGST